MRRALFQFFFLAIVSFGAYSQKTAGNYLYRCNEKLVEIIMEDLFTPPVASRVQVYPNIAAYEVLCYKDSRMRPMAGQLTGLSRITAPPNKTDLSLSALIAFTTVARRLIYSEYMVDEFVRKETVAWLLANKNDTVLLNNSMAFGRSSGEQIIDWMKKDVYDYTRTLTRYIVADSAGAWQPTAPDYGNAIEPNWPLMRSLVFDSATMIKGVPPTKYSEQKTSGFYKNAYNLYKQSRQLDTTKRLIASFWDCNPTSPVQQGISLILFIKFLPAAIGYALPGRRLKTGNWMK